MSSSAFLVLDDDVAYVGSIKRLLHPHGSVVAAYRASDALHAKAPGGYWTALAFDVELPDGNGLDVLKQLRARGETAPALIVTARVLEERANQALALGAKIVGKSIDPSAILAFALEAVARRRTSREAVANDWAARFGLTPREKAILYLSMLGRSREEVSVELKMTHPTLDKHAHNLAQKTGHRNLLHVVQQALQETFSR
jgi:two-component system response regulator FixJ